jgi:protein gp37
MNHTYDVAISFARSESGPHARPMSASWVEDIRDQCLTARVPFFFK